MRLGTVRPDGDASRAGRRSPVRARRRRTEPRLALTVAFISGLTSLGYQVLWTRLLASGTGNTTYVFTVILAVFLIGLAIGALLFTFVRPRIQDPVRLLAVAQIAGRGAGRGRARRRSWSARRP